MLSQGANKAALNCNGETPFDCTTELEIREYVQEKKTLNTCVISICKSMLHVLGFVTPSRLLAVGINELLVAACTGDSDKIRTLVIEEGFSPSHEFQQGVTALHEACEGGHEQCVAVLIELGAVVNQQVSY